MTGDVHTIFLRLQPRDIALAKFLFESYEDVAIVRTLDRATAVIVVLAVPDFAAAARAITDELCDMVECEIVPPPPDAGGDWLLAAMSSCDRG
jgi:hypothetical protein